MRTSQLQNQDKNQSFTQMNIQKFEIFKNVFKRAPSVKSVMTPSMKKSNNAAVLADYGIQYDNPPTPVEVAERRTERINKEKAKQLVRILVFVVFINKNIEIENIIDLKFGKIYKIYIRLCVSAYHVVNVNYLTEHMYLISN